MLHIENKCPNCGAVISAADTYCRTCYNALECERPPEEATLEGIAVSDWHLFIDKNASRYVTVFSKNEGKKIFIHMNWSAMFFSFYWMFYRKMYKYAFLFLLISMAFSIGLATLAATVVKPDFRELVEIAEPYSQYFDDKTSLYNDYFDGLVDFTELQHAADEYSRMKSLIIAKYSFIVTVPTLIFGVLFGLLADCLYRHYILKNVQYKNGGTSGWALVGGMIVYVLSNNLIAEPLVTSIAINIWQ